MIFFSARHCAEKTTRRLREPGVPSSVIRHAVFIPVIKRVKQAGGFNVVKGFFTARSLRSLDHYGQLLDDFFSRHDIVPRKQPVATANQG
jgi:hypothetical protein